MGKLKWKPYKLDVQASCHGSVWFLEADFVGEIPKEGGELSCQLMAASTLLRLQGEKFLTWLHTMLIRESRYKGGYYGGL